MLLMLALVASSLPPLAMADPGQAGSRQALTLLDDGAAAASPAALLVRFSPEVSEAGAVERLMGLGADALSHDGSGLYQVWLTEGRSSSGVLAYLRALDGVRYAELNHRLRGSSEVDEASLTEGNWALGALGAAEAWATLSEQTVGRDPIVVAVVDTGIDPEHPDLIDRLLTGQNVITGSDDLSDTADDSESGHGTHVAGLVAQAAGPYPVQILPIKALDANVEGSIADVAAGIRWAADWIGTGGERVQVLNLSLGERLEEFPQVLAEAVAYAQEQGILVVAAAGNDGGSVAGYYPAALPGVLSVAAHGPEGLPHVGAPDDADLMAPGVAVSSVLPGGGYGERSGSSSAAPIATASAALIRLADPGLTADEVAAALAAGQREYEGGHRGLSMVLALEAAGVAPGDSMGGAPEEENDAEPAPTSVRRNLQKRPQCRLPLSPRALIGRSQATGTK